MLASLIKRLGARQAPGAGQPGVSLSVNDPRWGHRLEDGRKNQEGRRPNKDDDNDGPPELAELWRDFNARLSRLLGKREGGGGGPYRPDSRGVGITVAVVGGIAVLIWLSSGSFVVQDGQVGIVSTFGRPSYKAAPGFNWRWPAPFQSHRLVDVAKVQTAEIGYRNNVRSKQPAEALMPTGDENLVDVQFSVQYKVRDPMMWVSGSRDQAETLRGAAESVVRELVGASTMDTMLGPNRDRVAADAARRIQQLADRYHLGAGIVGVTMQSVAVPDAVAGAVADTVKARDDAARERNLAQTYAADVVAQAKARAAHQIQEAEANRTKVVDTATGEAARFDQVAAEYAKAPGVTRDRIYLDTMQQIFSSTSKIMIDAKTPTTVNLPLDRMVAQVAANEAAIGSHSGPVMPPMQPAQQGQAPAQAMQPAQTQPQQQPQQQPQPAQPSQPAQTAQPAQAAPAPQAPSESVRQRDPRSRENARERETR